LGILYDTITVKWKKKYGLENKKVEHELYFDGAGKESSFFLEIERSKIATDN
jgi:hypothetical protein